MIDLERIKRAPVFQGFDDGAVEAILALGQEENFEAGTRIFREGDPGQYLYIVLDGTVAIHCGDKFIAKCKPFDAFGEMATLQQRPRSASARAITDVRAMAFGEQHVKALLNTPHAVQFLLNVIAILSKRLETGNAWIANSLEAQRQQSPSPSH